MPYPNPSPGLEHFPIKLFGLKFNLILGEPNLRQFLWRNESLFVIHGKQALRSEEICLRSYTL